MFEFSAYTWLIAMLAVGGFVWAVFHKQDLLHPLAVLMPMVLFLYVFLPYELTSTNMIELAFFKPDQWAHVQLINLLCIGALIGGCVLASRRGRGDDRPGPGDLPARAADQYGLAPYGAALAVAIAGGLRKQAGRVMPASI